MRLGIDDYGIRHQGWDHETRVTKAIELGAANLMLSLDGLSAGDTERLAGLRSAAQQAGLTLEAGGGGWNPHRDGSQTATAQDHERARDRLAEWIRISERLGASVLRGLLGGRHARHAAVPLETQMRDTAAVLRDLAPEARKRGVRLAPETHWDLTAREMLRFLDLVGMDEVGVTFDTGNQFCLLEDPLEGAELLRDRIISTVVRDAAVHRTPRGVVVQWCVMGSGSARFAEIRDVIAAANPDCSWNLELILDGGPVDLPFLEPDFWTPGWQLLPAEQLARFQSMLDAVGSWPEEADRYLPESAHPVAALARQEWVGFQRSWTYCKDVLGIQDLAAVRGA